MEKVNLKFIIKKIPRMMGQVIQMGYYKMTLPKKKKEKYKNAWLITERGTEARDNGYAFFSYIRKEHPEIPIYYIIDTNSPDYEKVRKLGPIIPYHSKEHKWAFLASHIYISTHIGHVEPWNYLLCKKTLQRNGKFFFLQHGIIMSDLSDVINHSLMPLDLFVTSTNQEYQSILKNSHYGYAESSLALTGLPRFDTLKNENGKRQILLMPSWRSSLSQIFKTKVDDKVKQSFLTSHYYKHYHKLLTNPKLLDLLDRYDVDLIFYPHYEMQRYAFLFESMNEHIIIARKERFDVQTLLKESNLLITDYSSVAFDFAYLKKPILYDQFDQEEFYQTQYQKGYFDYIEDGFGDVITKDGDLIRKIKEMIKRDFHLPKKYEKRIHHTFFYFDTNHCKRVYEEIIKRIK